MSGNESEFRSGDSRGDRMHGISFNHLDVDQEIEDLQKIVTAGGGEDVPGAPEEIPEEITIIDTDRVERSTQPNSSSKVMIVAKVLAAIAVCYVLYLIINASMVSDSASQVQNNNEPEPKVQNNNQSEPKVQSANQSVAKVNPADGMGQTSELDQIKQEFSLLKDEVSKIKQRLTGNSDSGDNTVIEERLRKIESQLLLLQEKTPTQQSDDNDVATRVMAALIPEIRKQSEMQANSIKKTLAAKFASNELHVSGPARESRPNIPKPLQMSGDTKFSKAEHDIAGSKAKDLIFVMATTDLMIVRAGDDELQRTLTLRPGEYLKGRGVIKSISPRGCVMFDDGSTYEVMNREGACTKER